MEKGQIRCFLSPQFGSPAPRIRERYARQTYWYQLSNQRLIDIKMLESSDRRFRRSMAQRAQYQICLKSKFFQSLKNIRKGWSISGIRLPAITYECDPLFATWHRGNNRGIWTVIFERNLSEVTSTSIESTEIRARYQRGEHRGLFLRARKLLGEDLVTNDGVAINICRLSVSLSSEHFGTHPNQRALWR